MLTIMFSVLLTGTNLNCIVADRFSERGKIFSKEEIRSIQAGPGGIFFTGDGTGLMKVWKWLAEQPASM